MSDYEVVETTQESSYKKKPVQHVSRLMQQQAKPSKKEISILLFHARWCPGCQELKPVFEDLMRKNREERLEFKMVDVDDEGTEIYGIQKIPAVGVYVNATGQELQKVQGGLNEESLRKFVKFHRENNLH